MPSYGGEAAKKLVEHGKFFLVRKPTHVHDITSLVIVLSKLKCRNLSTLSPRV